MSFIWPTLLDKLLWLYFIKTGIGCLLLSPNYYKVILFLLKSPVLHFLDYTVGYKKKCPITHSISKGNTCQQFLVHRNLYNSWIDISQNVFFSSILELNSFASQTLFQKSSTKQWFFRRKMYAISSFFAL